MEILRGSNFNLGSISKKIKNLQCFNKKSSISRKNLQHNKSKLQVFINLLRPKGLKKLQLKKRARRTKIKKKETILKNLQMQIKLMKIT
jgi:hypothetical protein